PDRTGPIVSHGAGRAPGGHAAFDVWMTATEIGQTRDQPTDSKGWAYADGEFEPVGLTQEHCISKPVLQKPHHVTHRGLGDIQLLRCRLEAAQPTSRFESSQSIQ